MNMDIRWIQRFRNYERALSQLEEAVVLKEQRKLTKLEKQGMIQAFEFTHELAWKTLKDFLQSRGNMEIYGSKDATREAFKLNLIEDGSVWMEMIQSRNLTSHTYDEATADEIINSVHQLYFQQFVKLHQVLQRLIDKQEAGE